MRDEIVVVHMESAEEKRRLERFFEILLEADLKVLKRLSENQYIKQKK